MMARYTVDLAELQVLYFLAEGFTPREASEEAEGEMRDRYLLKGSSYTGGA
jgi:hypothetical protein